MRRIKRALLVCLIVLAIVSTSLLVYIGFGGGAWLVQTSYLQSTDQLYIMETGILYNERVFQPGQNLKIKYEFNNEEYAGLLNKYDLAEQAGDGSEFEKALALMDEYSGRLYHEPYYDNHIDLNAMDLLDYSLDNRKQGINCRAKAQILNEMCLSLGIYSRKLWINPNSVYDQECHVVNEVWDSDLKKWVMLDITNNFYWVDGNGTPLSVLEIRDHLANQEFCTPVAPDDDLKNLERSRERNYDNLLYIAKNMAYMYYCVENTVGESDEYFFLIPKAWEEDGNITCISREAIEKLPAE